MKHHSFDPKCLNLAKTFLKDEAQLIQETIERWIKFESDNFTDFDSHNGKPTERIRNE